MSDYATRYDTHTQNKKIRDKKCIGKMVLDEMAFRRNVTRPFKFVQ